MRFKKSILFLNLITLPVLSSNTNQSQDIQSDSASSSTYELRNAIIQHIMKSPDFSDDIKRESTRTLLPDQLQLQQDKVNSNNQSSKL